jgi:molecular chaperone DnaK
LRHSEIFSTASDNQTSVEIHALAGVRPMAKDNLSIGKFHLVGIPPAPRGVPQIEVTFDVDADGILNVSAKDFGTGREQKITINSLAPSQEEINRILRDAESHSAEDTRKGESIEARNRLDGLIYSVEKSFGANKGTVTSDTKNELDAALVQAKTALADEDIPAMNKAYYRLEKASLALPSGKSFRDLFQDLFGEKNNPKK